MYKLEFIDVDNTNIVFEVSCTSINTLMDVTNFGDKTEYNTTRYLDYNSYAESDLLSEEEIKFEVMVLGTINYDDFKRFIRERNKNFLVRVTKDKQRPRMAICKHYNERIEELGTTGVYKWYFSLLRETRWIEISTIGFSLDSVNGMTSGYADSNLFTGGYTYTDNLVLGSSAQTIENFNVPLPFNDGDKYAYIRVAITDADVGFGFGLDDKVDDTIASFRADDSLIINDNQLLVVDSFPFFKQMSLITLPENTPLNVQHLRDFEKRTYLRVPLGEHELIFNGVRSGTIVMYKQYRLPY